MTARRQRRNPPGPARSNPARSDPKPNPPQITPTPLKPRRNLMLALLVVYALWMAALLCLYFTQVNPRTHSQRATTPASSPR